MFVVFGFAHQRHSQDFSLVQVLSNCVLEFFIFLSLNVLIRMYGILHHSSDVTLQ